MRPLILIKVKIKKNQGECLNYFWVLGMKMYITKPSPRNYILYQTYIIYKIIYIKLYFITMHHKPILYGS